jgi:hypothetical protein
MILSADVKTHDHKIPDLYFKQVRILNMVYEF